MISGTRWGRRFVLSAQLSFFAGHDQLDHKAIEVTKPGGYFSTSSNSPFYELQGVPRKPFCALMLSRFSWTERLNDLAVGDRSMAAGANHPVKLGA